MEYQYLGTHACGHGYVHERNHSLLIHCHWITRKQAIPHDMIKLAGGLQTMCGDPSHVSEH